MRNQPFASLMENLEKGLPDLMCDIAVLLRVTNCEYAELYKKQLALADQFPCITKTLEDSGVVSLTVEEHKRLLEYLGLKLRMEDIERIQIYYAGHRDCLAYLKKVGLVCGDMYANRVPENPL